MSKATLIKNVVVLDKHSDLHKKNTNILVRNGVIEEIGATLSEGDEVVDAQGAFISAGWLAYDVDCGLPGREDYEKIPQLLQAALQGGFTGVISAPIGVYNRSHVEYVTKSHQLEQSKVDLYPIAAASIKGEGKEMTEMFDMKEAGAVVFGDEESTENAGVLLRSLLYMRDFNAKAQLVSKDQNLSRDAAVFEGRQATLQGLKAMPELAVETRLQRDLALQEYTGTACLFKDLATVNSIELVAAQKQKGCDVYSALPSYLLCLNDESLETFDTAYKLDPPLRSEGHREAFVDLLKSDKIDIISAKHRPHPIENKAVEFDHADYGMINLQTLVPSLFNTLGTDLYEVLDAVSNNVRKFLGQKSVVFEIGSKAEFTIFESDSEWVFSKAVNCSVNENSPFMNSSFKLKVLGIFNHNGYVKAK